MMLYEGRFLITAFLLILISSACREEAVSDSQITNPKFFDLKGYFDHEIKRLDQLQPTVTKTLALNGNTETRQLTQLDYARELDLFQQADLNRPDWLDRYRADSTVQNNQLTAIRYTALDEKLRTRQLAISFKNGQVSSISIQNGAKSMAAGSQQQLVYEPTKGYRIESVQHTAISKAQVLQVAVTFRN
jgi:hypothetical protein